MKAQMVIHEPMVLTVEEKDGFIVRLEFGKKLAKNVSLKRTGLLCTAKMQILEYFQGKRKEFTLPLSYAGTAFQNQVWEVLRLIPYGTTVSYQQIAEKIGNAGAVRAVGTAIGKNPLGILIPCHRVIGKDGGLGGFSGGLDNKKLLLKLEEKWR